MAESFHSPSHFTYPLHHLIKGQTHGTGERDALVLMFPRGKDEKTAFGTSLEVLVAGLGEGIEAPGGEEDEREAGIEGGSHHGLFSFRDGWRDQDGTLLGKRKEIYHLGLNVCFGKTTGELHLHFDWMLKKELVANDGIGLACYSKTKADTEKVGMSTTNGKAAWVLMQVGLPAVKLA